MEKETIDKIKHLENELNDLLDQNEETPDEKLQKRLAAIKANLNLARKKSYEVKSNIENYAKEYPWQTIMISAAVGALIASLMVGLKKRE